MDDTHLIFDDIRVSLDFLKHWTASLSQELNSLLEGPSRPGMDREMDIPTDCYELYNSNTTFRWSLATYQTAPSGSLLFQNTHFPAFLWPPIFVKGAYPFFLLYLILRLYFETKVRISLMVAWALLPWCSGSGDGPYLFFES